MNTTRRRFLKIAAAGAGAAALAPMSAIAAEAPGFGPNEVGMLYDSTLCVGCKACVSSCRKVNFYDNLDPIVSDADSADNRWSDDYELNYRTRNIIKMHRDEETGEPAFIKRQCNHCKSPGCVSACPVKAMTKNPETGVVEYDMKKCIGCRYCMIACPFTVPTFEWHRALPRIVKCELCSDTNLKNKDLPACCEVCPTKAVIYGKRSDLLADAKNRMAANPNKYIN
jgi:Fe-S-cluster-containing dehydrogenase component